MESITQHSLTHTYLKLFGDSCQSNVPSGEVGRKLQGLENTHTHTHTVVGPVVNPARNQDSVNEFQ